jgi:hypothetical protein
VLDSTRLKEAIQARNIRYVWHFTQLENLKSILVEGLLPRSELERRSLPPKFNDLYRLDLQRGAICCSIGHPNYKMFYALRKRNVADEWVVIAVKPEVLWEKDCAFCVENAASNNVTRIPLDQRKGIEAFDKLFDDCEGKPSRGELGLPTGFPTNPQAEILIFDTIEPAYMLGASVQSQETLDNGLTSYLYPDGIGNIIRIYEICRFSVVPWYGKDSEAEICSVASRKRHEATQY